MSKWLTGLLLLVIVLAAGLILLERKAINAKPEAKETILKVDHVPGL